MTGFIEGEDRAQVTLFLEALDDHITEENSVGLGKDRKYMYRRCIASEGYKEHK